MTACRLPGLKLHYDQTITLRAIIAAARVHWPEFTHSCFVGTRTKSVLLPLLLIIER